MKELTIEATPENVDKAIEFVDEMLEEPGCRVRIFTESRIKTNWYSCCKRLV